MTAASIRGLLIAIAMSILAAPSYGQEATFTGTATDSSGGVLPGVTITATHEATGNVFTTVTDERGEFRLPVRVGAYIIKAELSGFATVNRTMQILIGQTADVDMRLSPSAVSHELVRSRPTTITRVPWVSDSAMFSASDRHAVTSKNDVSASFHWPDSSRTRRLTATPSLTTAAPLGV